MNRFTLCLTFCVLALAACDHAADRDTAADTAVGDTGPTLTLRPGAAFLACPSPRGFAVDGDRVVVISRLTSAGGDQLFDATACVSEDHARSFRAVPIGRAALAGVEINTVVAGAGHVWLVLADEDFAGTLLYAKRVVARELDLMSGALGPDVELAPGTLWVGPAELVLFSRSGAAEAERRVSFTRMDLATGAVTRSDAPAPGGDCREPPFGSFFASSDGDLFVRACYRRFDFCVQRARRSGPSFEEVCSTYPDWPLPWRDPQADMVLDGMVARVRGDHGHMRARPFLASGAAPFGDEVAIGDAVSWSSPLPGVLVASDGVHPATPMAVHGATLVPLAAPDTACDDPAACPLLGAVPPPVARLGEHEWLFFYVTSAGPAVLAYHEGDGTPPTFAMPAVLPEPSGGDWIAFQPAESDLERACALAVSCDGGQGMFPQTCLDYWEVRRGTSPEADAAYDRFVATRACAELTATWPARFAPTMNGAFQCFGARCLPDGRAVSCDMDVSSADFFVRVRECASVDGATCTVSGDHAGCALAGAACDSCDAAGRSIRCTNGAPDWIEDCAAEGFACREAAHGTPGCLAPVAIASCEGSVFREVDERNVVVATRDCARANMPCTAPLGCTGDSGDRITHCSWDLPGCDGPRMVWTNASGQSCSAYQRWVDCTTLGASGCAGGRCTF